jgi:hypothetical protein
MSVLFAGDPIVKSDSHFSEMPLYRKKVKKGTDYLFTFFYHPTPTGTNRGRKLFGP